MRAASYACKPPPPIRTSKPWPAIKERGVPTHPPSSASTAAAWRPHQQQSSPQSPVVGAGFHYYRPSSASSKRPQHPQHPGKLGPPMGLPSAAFVQLSSCCAVVVRRARCAVRGPGRLHKVQSACSFEVPWLCHRPGSATLPPSRGRPERKARINNGGRSCLAGVPGWRATCSLAGT